MSGPVAWTRIWFSEPYPVSDCCTALTGAIAMSFGSLKPAPPFSASTPMTVNSVPPTVICLPIGSAVREQLLGDGRADQHDPAAAGHVVGR